MAAEFSDRETALICAMIKHMEVPIKVNWNAAAAETGHASGASAQRQWCKLKLKHEIGGADTPAKPKDGAKDGTPKTKTPNKRKAAASKSEDGLDEQVEGTESPVAAKKARQTKPKKANGATKVKDELEEDAT